MRWERLCSLSETRLSGLGKGSLAFPAGTVTPQPDLEKTVDNGWMDLCYIIYFYLITN